MTWTQTLGLRLTVVNVDEASGVARVEGKVFGVREVYEAPIAQLRPCGVRMEVVSDEAIEDQLGSRLPEKIGVQGQRLKPKAPRSEMAEEHEDVIQRLIFDPKLFRFYRRQFAKGSTIAAAESQLREELGTARLIRKRHTGEYLRFRVPGRFDVVLDDRPVQGEVGSCYVSGLHLPQKKSRRKRRAA